MSSQGISVHEANLESKLVTFQGFPWCVVNIVHHIYIALSYEL